MYPAHKGLHGEEVQPTQAEVVIWDPRCSKIPESSREFQTGDRDTSARHTTKRDQTHPRMPNSGPQKN